jgi:hypothetical protein
MYLVAVRVTPVAGSVRVSALDDRRLVIPGQDQSVSAAMTVVFRANGIAALRITGQAGYDGVVGVAAEALANASGWIRFDTVGLPFKQTELDPTRYDPIPQGPEPPTLDGVIAALQRLTLAEAAHLPLPAPPAPLPSVAWPAPPPDPFLISVRDNRSVGGAIRRCIAGSDNRVFGHRQFDFRDTSTVRGIVQADHPVVGAPDAQVALPVVGVTQLLASGDGFAAVALGYGTMDIGRPGRNPTGAPAGETVTMTAGPILMKSERSASTRAGGFDYMVTGVFAIPFGTVELAALADIPAVPETPGPLSFERAHLNRPVDPDTAGGEAVRVSWAVPEVPAGFAVAVSRRAGTIEVLNARRLCGTGYDTFFPTRLPVVDGAPAPDDQVTFTDALSPTPIAGTETHHYAVAALDVFDRWSAWRVDDRVVTAPAVQMPALLHVELMPDATAPIGSGLGGTIEVTVGWNAEDRTVERIELFGKFIDSTATPEPAFAGGFLDGAAATAPVSVRIQGAPALGERLATVTDLSATATDLRFRVAVADAVFPFGDGPTVAFAVWARAYEHVRPLTPSGLTDPSRGEARDPRPPTVPGLSPNLTWTALPDATRRARGILTWSPSSNTAGYVLWEATETAILEAFGQPAAAPGTPLPTRALTLQTLLGTVPDAEAKLTSVFHRWNSALLTATRAEIDLPGSADILYAYRISAVSATNVEGSRSSGFAFLAIPSRAIPGPPILSAAGVSTGAGPRVRVTASPSAHSALGGFRLFRVRKPEAAGSLGTMGPPLARESDPRWVTDGPARRIEDDPGPSWKPLYYRAVAFAPDDLPMGKVGGESAPSGVLRCFLPPADAPTLTDVLVSPELRFRTDLPDFATPIGTARIEVFQLLVEGGRIRRASMAAADPATVSAGAPTDTSFGKAVAGSVVTWSLALGGITADRVVIVATDPLGRSTEITAEL